MYEITKNRTSTKRAIIKFLITILITFIVQIILCVTQGYMRLEEYEEYARTVENANITTVLGPLMFTGPLYTFIIAIIIAVVSKIFIKKDEQMKKILYYMPLYVILLFAPVWLTIVGFCKYFNINF